MSLLNSRQDHSIILSQELYEEMSYIRPVNRFHVMQADQGPTGLSFASVEEDKAFFKLVSERLNRLAPKQAAPARPAAPPQPAAPTRPVGGISTVNRPVVVDTSKAKKGQVDNQKKKVRKQ